VVVAPHYLAEIEKRIVTLLRRQVAAGDLSARIAESSSDEIAQVAFCASIYHSTKTRKQLRSVATPAKSNWETLLNSIPNGVIAIFR